MGVGQGHAGHPENERADETAPGLACPFKEQNEPAHLLRVRLRAVFAIRVALVASRRASLIWWASPLLPADGLWAAHFADSCRFEPIFWIANPTCISP